MCVTCYLGQKIRFIPGLTDVTEQSCRFGIITLYNKKKKIIRKQSSDRQRFMFATG